jgi:hypothetical protein
MTLDKKQIAIMCGISYSKIKLISMAPLLGFPKHVKVCRHNKFLYDINEVKQWIENNDVNKICISHSKIANRIIFKKTKNETFNDRALRFITSAKVKRENS